MEEARANGLLCYCRPGFEPELAAELGERAAHAGDAGWARAERNTGYVQFFSAQGHALAQALPLDTLVFARQKLRLLAELRGLDAKDRITPIVAALFERAAFGDLIVEHPDSDEARPLAGLARSFGNALRPALRKAGLLTAQADPRLPRLHVCFLAGDHALLATGHPRGSSPWPSGIPRLRTPPEAPSRSALKLEEALMVLLDPDERARWVRPGMHAADLGAAPGGWTWVLARNGLHVTAIDNGPLRQHVLDSALVDHVRADGFRWSPARPLDWMVCDMVESPKKVTARMAEWFREGWCRHAIFNLKLPMKNRWDETRDCLAMFEAQAQRPVQVRARQLYHDREEITVFAQATAH